MADERTVVLETADGVARLTLNRPDKLNSFTRRMHADLREALTAIEGDPAIRAVVLTGAGRGFCAGQDLADLSFEPGAMTDLGALIQENFNPLIRRLQALPKPVVAKVRGIAAGAGANLALACDLVVAGRSASFLQAFVNIGLLPDSGGTWLLPRTVGSARAMGLAMLGEKLPAETAERWGMIWRCVDDDALDAEVDALAAKLARMPTAAIASIKHAIRHAATADLDAQLDLERDEQTRLGASHDYAEGVNAFLQKRAPRFEGR
ncbi:MAG: 2-(1,2-epoxy-1,2-dihydrophenyl)acetyl-CoA isomerase PaaG [Burkholderiaceae bacterium]|jgi:2-(1,2-epoxy-1,2-dihydrophenyl)acetyl-CoA isomerase|nr:2-(1,2-epoxy-1,2-dihydrophenyl)acetyl-CoA isomerase [Burkholderiales bacterium]MCZ8106143.1 2-(1,2-epoxy-1,2-dihydrophenyl)acetyl-CoA isomerase PaaG [Burkholderiales bacterium]MCZ8338712.1 2-(1,2-epoxy-1,2-dihydrophenyl)acetyl-CoA isomerase PaaG [Burkholderiaceae bacterium]